MISFVPLIATLTIGSPAAPAPPPPKTPSPGYNARVAHFVDAAQRHWGGTPYKCPNGLRVYVRPMPGKYGQAFTPGCSIWLAPVTRSLPGWYLCRVVVHEYGHTMGCPHVEDPNSIMTTHVPLPPVRECPHA